MPATPITDPRQLAVQCLWEVARQGRLIPETMARIPCALSQDDRALANELVYGSFRQLPGLEKNLATLCKPEKLPSKLRWLLIASLYQLGFMRVPAYAVVDEANRLAGLFKFPGLKPLVNGVLRNAARRGEDFWRAGDAASRLLPDWLERLLTGQYGSQLVREWLADWERPGAVCYWQVEKRPGETDEVSPYLPHGLLREQAFSQKDLASLGIYVQNHSSQAVAELVCRSGSRTVLDLCAAPGGKACYMDAFGKDLAVTAWDAAPDRLARLRENRRRLGLDFEVLERPPEPDRHFDMVLVDAPCSGIGIAARHPEIKLLRKEPAGEDLRRIQRGVLDQGWAHVKPGGYLLFTVCSLDSREVPEPPADAVSAGKELGQWLPTGLPAVVEDNRFRISPAQGFDGFLGILIRKPG